MDKVCFVVLHYKDEKATSDCINSLIDNILREDVHIIVVDNGSGDGSGEFIKKSFEAFDNIHTIINKDNIGYAKGNNIGYCYAKEELQANYIVILNNDTLIKQSFFVEKIIQLYNEKQFYIMGPDILSLSRSLHQSPLRDKPLSSKELREYLKVWDDFENKIIRNRLKYLMKGVIGKKTLLLYRKFKNSRSMNDSDFLYKYEQENVVLHGACVVFSPLYVSREKEAFFSETFLYFEEDILTYLCNKKNMKIIYSPIVQVLHYEDQSTNKVVKKEFAKELFKIKHQRHSAKVFLNLMGLSPGEKGN
ncbi:glycosyltransferase family 2 protein [Paenibacillus sonchi]|uniref:Glycosyltransferase family 2 protein n=1 Tax=Paenibacillus sonchi TaxID=373687 RepID=A0A974SDU7_9BACL|nr:glycosyltransferase [Paenibacillus sonchi]QQZ61616.1 glycosyltransferase family 2 protein [Paenibacillus sonchi]